MSNYYTDQPELKFHLHHPLMERIVELKERNFADKEKYEDAPVDFNDAMENYEKLLDRIGEVDSIVTEVLGRVPGRTFAIYHPTLSYLAEDYGVVQLCLENAGKESSALHLKQMIAEARESNVKTVFVQREFNAKQVETFAAETGARVTIINPLNYDWDKEIIRIAYAIAAD